MLWNGCWGPKDLPKDIVKRWNTEIAKAVSLSDIKERLAGEGLDPAAGPPEGLRDVLKRDVSKWTKVERKPRSK